MFCFFFYRLDANTTIQDIIKNVEKASRSYLKNIIKISNDEAVSSDFIGDSHSCILDADSSLQLKPNFYKIICWYENEYSYACRVLDSIFFSEKQFNIILRSPSKMTYVRAKPAKTQDEVQQTERNIKEMSIECNYNTEIPKIVSSTSQETGIKTKAISRPVLQRKPHTGNTPPSSATGRTDPKKRNELFKIWNDSTEGGKVAQRQNRSSFFHSCMSFGPKNNEKTDCMKAQERLENVKKEFSKMVNITEDLLKKSYSNKIQLEVSAKSSKEGEKFGTSSNGSQVGSAEESISPTNGKCTMKLSSNNPIFKVCGDFKNKVISSPNTESSKEEVRNNYDRNENMSDYNISSDLKVDKPRKPCLKVSLDDSTKNRNIGSSQTIKTLTWFTDTKNKIKSSSFVKTQSTKSTKITDDLSSNIQVQCAFNDQKVTETQKPDLVKSSHSTDREVVIKIIDTTASESEPEKHSCDTQTVPKVIKEPDPPEKVNLREFTKYLHNKDYNMHVIDEELKKRNIVLVNDQKENSDINVKSSDNSDQYSIDLDERRKTLSKQILESLSRLAHEPLRIRDDVTSGCGSPENTVTTISNGDGKRRKPDLYDKLDSASGTDSNNSFEINERKSQVIHITDLSNSLEDLARLDKICRIIEISDELSDKLFSALDKSELKSVQERKWSFKDLCERIQLDDFCNKVFGKT